MQTGGQIVLRGLEPADLPDRHRWLNDPEVTRYFTTLGATPLSFPQLTQWYQSLDSRTEIHFAVYTPEALHIGGAQLKSIDWKNRSAELGLFIGEPQFRGRGLGQQITRRLAGYGFDTLNLHRLWLRVDEANQAAIHCYLKCGFQKEGRFRDEVFRAGTYHSALVMSLLEDEWQKRVNR